MVKTIFMLLGIAALFALGTACFSPSSKVDKTSPVYNTTNSTTAPR